MINEPPSRRPSSNFFIDAGAFSFVLTIGYDPTTAAPCEVFIAERGKPGELNTALYELGIAISKTLQGEDYERDDTLFDDYPEGFL